MSKIGPARIRNCPFHQSRKLFQYAGKGRNNVSGCATFPAPHVAMAPSQRAAKHHVLFHRKIRLVPVFLLSLDPSSIPRNTVESGSPGPKQKKSRILTVYGGNETFSRSLKTKEKSEIYSATQRLRLGRSLSRAAILLLARLLDQAVHWICCRQSPPAVQVAEEWGVRVGPGSKTPEGTCKTAIVWTGGRVPLLGATFSFFFFPPFYFR